MESIKKLLFGIALIILGLFCLYLSSLSGWGVFEVIGLIIPAVGFGFAIAGLLDKSE